MTPKQWPKRLVYSRESVAAEMNLSFLRYCLFTGDLVDLDKTSRVIGEKCVHPDIRIEKITQKNGSHPLYREQTLKGHANYGIFATRKIPRRTEIGEYVGELYLRSAHDPMEVVFDKTSSSEYAWIIKVNQFFLIIDAEKTANELALINDYRGIKGKPNVKMQPIVHQGAFYFGYVSVCDILPGEELVVDYGEAFWDIFQKKKNQPRSI